LFTLWCVYFPPTGSVDRDINQLSLIVEKEPQKTDEEIIFFEPSIFVFENSQRK